ncbi:hypothetical protein J2Z40_002351 [Cytobacillus eiseniae]|uniref:Beta-galactosidase n=1 Tax=Cytobacillus eiseniae TaxID=762947 RepID=A0ABS4RFV3_9BACI|nr:sugar-binding domain-containing protein [Cytobacillus eiseniae]MBP2241779.1 hypothetical protein [Cytobacillus eiseniae]
MVGESMNQLYTVWGEDLKQDHVLQEYPRPQMKRDSYLNLNGYWDYAISESEVVDSYDGEILVPFSPESVLSGVQRVVTPNDYLFYYKEVVLPNDFMKDHILLHFGAVDQICELWINDQYVGKHIGGFTPFHFDITDYVIGSQFAVKLRVKDVTDTSYHQTGKQRIDRGGIWYTPQSGIWQTVWIESVPSNYIQALKLTSLFDEKKVKIELQKAGTGLVKAEVYFGNELEGTTESEGDEIIISVQHLYPWTPETPNLYQIKLIYHEDIIESYIGMRHIERKKDEHGIFRFYLNHQPYFQSGVLDQGYYPDGLLTPPSDEAMIYDIEKMKEMGFNMLRKHIKIEPLRWYYHCDRLGMLVWQDMINGSERKDIIFHGLLANLGVHLKDHRYKLFGRKNETGRNQFLTELEEMLVHLQSVTSIVTWVPFNEAWGQFDAVKVEKMVRNFDHTRLIDHASGWSDQYVGDYYSRHTYFTKLRFRRKHGGKRISALTEFGGYSLPIKGHRFHDESIFGYKKYDTEMKLEEAYTDLYQQQVVPQIKNGLSVLIYTQLSDVEDEMNGLLTYDRKINKMSTEKVKEINELLYSTFHKQF